MEMPLNRLTDRQLALPHFPTRRQAFIFRNWDMVPAREIARILRTDDGTVCAAAAEMGLPPQTRDLSPWMQKGYITIIRANWHLLSYAQLMDLLGWDRDRLSLVLKEDDFLGHKLQEKPDCPELVWEPLSAGEQAATATLRAVMEREVLPFLGEDTTDPFDFFRPDYPEETAPVPSGDPALTVAVDGSWSLLDETGDENAAFMAGRFRESMAALWNVSLGSADSPAPRQIVLRIGALKSEAHRVEIRSDRITVTAGDASGILRGLNLLEDMTREAGAFRFAPAVLDREPRFGARYIYSFCGLYNDAFEVDSSVYCPDSLLEAYAKAGVNGVWLQAVLYRLVEFPFEPSMSVGWEKRLAVLNGLIRRAARWGIRIYLYINEPRSMPFAFFEKYPEMRGAHQDDYACMCTSVPEVRKYLGDAVETLCRNAPGLGGFFTITMSENLTNCWSRSFGKVPDCPRCAKRAPWEVVAEVNRVITESAHRVDPSIRVIAWDWGWKGDRFSDANIRSLVKALPAETIVMGKRESSLPYTRGGQSSTVDDYTISVSGLSSVSRKLWDAAKSTGHRTAAKVQINNTWECSTVPYLPVFNLQQEQMDALIGAGVDNIMLSWTLGGAPSASIRMLSRAFFRDPAHPDTAVDYESAVRAIYGMQADTVSRAAAVFSDAFRNFPFHIGTLYRGPQNAGPANLLFPEPSGFESTMTCYAYDDLEHWRSIYPEDVFENQFRLVCEKWEEGLRMLDGMPVCEFKDMAFAGYALFRASLNQVRFVRARDAFLQGDASRRAELRRLASEERELARETWRIMLRNPSVGYEAANHYYFGRAALLEKIVNCAYLEELYAD